MRKYLLNPEELTKTSDNINTFKEELEILGEPGYVLDHFFGDRNEITSYGSITIKVNNKPDIDYILGVYKIEPNLVLNNFNGEYHIVFFLEKGISKNDYLRIAKTLEFIFGGELIDYYFFEGYKVVKEYENDKIDSELISFLTQLSLQLSSDVRYERIFSKENYENLILANNISFKEILEKLRLPLVEVDFNKNFHIKYGKPFVFLENYFDSQRKAFSFLNENFGLTFNVKDDKISKYSKEGLLIDSGSGFYSNNKGYYTLTKEGNAKAITDFKIKVYYKIKKTDGSMVYIVSLFNEDSGFESEKVNWCNSTSRTQFSDYIQKYGDFHFYGFDNDIKNIHKKIASTKTVPYIKSIIGYGYQNEDQIIIFKNGIWDIKEKVFTPKQDKYYFNYNFQGYLVVTNKGEEITEQMMDGIPVFNTDKIVKLDKILDFLSGLYNDDSGYLMFYYMCGSLGYLLHGDQYDTFPFFFAKGITSSGKTTFNELMLKMWGVSRGLDFANCSLFTMSFMLSHLIKFPYYIGEYRRNTPNAAQKEGIIRSTFDRKTQQKGKADQSIINYNFFGNLIMDGEEVFTDGAARSRIIQKRFISAHRISGNFNDLVREGQSILNNMMYSYFTISNKDKWQEGYKKGKEIFHPIAHKINSRIGDNFAMIYAGCYSVLGDNQKVKEVLIKSCEYQLEDFSKDGTSMQIIKAISKFLENNTFSFNSLLVGKDCIVIKWNQLDEYIKRYKVQLSLDVETYKEHIEALGYEVGYYDDGTSLTYGIIVPEDRIPKEFTINTEFYAKHKQYLNKKAIKDANKDPF